MRTFVSGPTKMRKYGAEQKSAWSKEKPMTELEAKLYNVFVQRLAVLAPMRGIEMTISQVNTISNDLAIAAARVLVKHDAMNHEGKK